MPAKKLRLATDANFIAKSKSRYASIDRPYNKFYKPEDLKYTIPKQTIWQCIYENNKDNPNRTALIYESQEISFGEFFEMVKAMARSLHSLGIGQDDKLASIITNIPQSVALLYAASYVGAIFVAMDPRDSEKEMTLKLSEAAPKLFFTFPAFTKIDNVNTPIDMKIVVLGDGGDSNHLGFDEFLKAGTSIELEDAAALTDEHVANIVYTGASTGAAKGVQLTDHSFNAMGLEWVKSGYNFGVGKILLDVLPQFIAYGVCNALHVPLMWGQAVELVDPLRIDKFPAYLKSSKATHVYASPVHIRFLKADPTAQNIDLSKLELFASGGAGMPVEEDENNYQWFAAHNAPNAYGQGYGMTEINAAFCYGNGDKNIPGYIGIPLSGNDAVIVDIDTYEELPYGEDAQGLLMLKTETVMSGYFGSAAYRDKDVFVEDANGNAWVVTGDICLMDESGRVRIIDRVGRGFNCMGMNMYPAVFEEVFAQHPSVKESVVTALVHEDYDMVPVAHIVVDMSDEFDPGEMADSLDEIVKRELPDYTQIYAYNFRADVPYTTRGKPDYKKIEKQGIDDLGNNVLILRGMGAK